MAAYLRPLVEAERLVERITDLTHRMYQVDQAHAAWFGRSDDKTGSAAVDPDYGCRARRVFGLSLRGRGLHAAGPCFTML